MKLFQNITFFILKTLSGIRKKVIGKHAKGILCSTDNGLLVVGADDLEVGRLLAFKGYYEDHALSELYQLVTRESDVCLIGAHVGTLLVPLAKRANTVVGYEANPETFELLKINTRINNLSNVDIFNYAIGNEKKEVEFYANTVNSGGSKIKPRFDSYAYSYDNPKIIKTNMISLDEHIGGKYEFDIIIMDIEGSEYYGFQGMQNALKTCKYLQLEYVPHHLENISHVTNEEYLSVFADYFESVRIVGEPENGYSRREFLPFLDRLRNSDNCADLLFSKDVL